MDESKEIKALFGKKPKEVINYFNNKVAVGPDKHWDWSDTLQHAHDRVFVVAKATSLDLVKDIQTALKSSIENGMPYQDFANNIIPILKEKGWWGKGDQIREETGEVSNIDINHRRLKNIYQTNVKTSYAAGKYERMMNNIDVAPYWRYIALSPGPTRRADHQKLHNLVFRYDDPFWKINYPPNGWGCKCRVEALSNEEVKRKFGKEPKDVIKKTADDDYVTHSVKVQGKNISVTGFKVGGRNVAYPQVGWDYAPGEYSYKYQRMLEDKISSLSESAARKELRHQLDTNLRESFKEIVTLESKIKMPKGSVFAVGMLPESIVKILDTKKDKAGRLLKLPTSILTIEDRRIAHALRSGHNEVPFDVIKNLPENIEKWTPTYNPIDGLVFYSEPFDGEMKDKNKNLVKKQVRYKIVFNRARTKNDMLVFKTATIVDYSALHPQYILK